MKRDLLTILACPVCHGKLELTVNEESDDEIVTGTLHCPVCSVDFPIEDTIPNLIPPEKPQ